ncbi:hypothetical protein TURU_121434 [Turdus rufiventris]|nr:hypothetical protein TURU_121434 [Turdus rufiventris]
MAGLQALPEPMGRMSSTALSLRQRSVVSRASHGQAPLRCGNEEMATKAREDPPVQKGIYKKNWSPSSTYIAKGFSNTVE